MKPHADHHPPGSAAQRAHRRALRWALIRQAILTTVLVVLWIMLWDAWSPVHIIAGIVIAVGLTRLFYLPPVELSGRINVLHLAVFAGWFAVQLVWGALQVAWIALRPRATAPGSVILVDLHTRSDLLITIIAQTAGLIPGTFVTEVDRARGVVFLHVLDCNTDAKIEAARRLALNIEVHAIKALGSVHDIHVLNEARTAAGLKPILGGRSVADLRPKTGPMRQLAQAPSPASDTAAHRAPAQPSSSETHDPEAPGKERP